MELVSVKSKSRKRIGRGLSSGQGKTAGRGTKGQKSRSGFNIPRKFEGGQTPLSMRLAKLPGFKSHKAKAEIITLDQISNVFKAGEEVTLKSLVEKGLIAKSTPKVKVLNNGTLAVAVKFGTDIKISKSVSTVIPAKAGIQEIKAEKAEPTTEEPKVKNVETPAKKAPAKTMAKKPTAKKETK